MVIEQREVGKFVVMDVEEFGFEGLGLVAATLPLEIEVIGLAAQVQLMNGQVSRALGRGRNIAAGKKCLLRPLKH